MMYKLENINPRGEGGHWDTSQTIDMIDCILIGFMKKMQCDTLNIKQSQKAYNVTRPLLFFSSVLVAIPWDGFNV